MRTVLLLQALQFSYKRITMNDDNKSKLETCCNVNVCKFAYVTIYK